MPMERPLLKMREYVALLKKAVETPQGTAGVTQVASLKFDTTGVLGSIAGIAELAQDAMKERAAAPAIVRPGSGALPGQSS